MRYIILLLLVSCNSMIDKKETISASGAYDSLSTALDSLKSGLQDLALVSDFAKEAQAKIEQYEKEKRETEIQRDKEMSYTVSDYTKYKSDDRDKRIAELTRKVYQYENEIASLKRKLANDSVKLSKVDRVPNEVIYEPEKPNDRSLVITLDRKMKTGEISLTGVDVYIIPYSKKVKSLMKYEINCDLTKLTDATQAGFYEGKYFFNDIKPGKYLIKICAYYGGFKVIEREDNYQMVAMQVSPPIQ